jgi:O-antigen/teichoic acid export membrane protein
VSIEGPTEQDLAETAAPRSQLASLVRHSAVYAVARIALSAMDLIFLPLYTRVLTPSEYGLVAVGTSMLAVFSLVYAFGFDGALMRLYFTVPDDSAERRDVVGGILVAMLAVGVATATALLAAGPTPFGDLLQGVSPRFFGLLAASALCNLLPMVWLQVLQLRQRPTAYLAASIAYALVRSLSIVVAVVILRRGAEGWAEAYLATTLIAAVAAVALIRPYVRFGRTLAVVREALPFGLPMLAHQAAGWLSVSAGRLLLNALVPLAAVGTYQVAFGVGQGIGLITTAVNFAYAPAFMAAAARSATETGQRFGRFATVYLGTLFLVAVLVALFRDPVIRLAAASRYAAAAPILPIVLATFVAQGIYFVLVNPIFYHRSSVRVLPLLTIGGAVVGLVGLRLLVPRIGIAGAAWAALASNVVVVLTAYPLSQRSLRMVYDHRRLGVAAGAGVGAVLASYLLAPRTSGPLEGFLLNLLLAGAYAGLLATVVGISPSRVRLVVATLRATD